MASAAGECIYPGDVLCPIISIEGGSDRSRLFSARRCRFGALVAVIGLAAATAAADPPDILRNYRFVTDKSTVDVTGGGEGIEWPLNILGKFDLVTGYSYDTGGPTAHIPTLVPFAQFTDVNALLFDPRRASPLPSPGWDLDKTLNLSGLTGTFTTADQLEFSGLDGQGQPIKLDASLSGPLMHLVGANNPGCCNFYNYKIDAYAHLMPWADFNSDGRVDGADITIWRQHFGSSVTPGADGDANGDGTVDATDYVVWRGQVGESVASGIGSAVVPEPGTLLLLPTGILAIFVRRHRTVAEKGRVVSPPVLSVP
jgi:Dockerin type I domain